jgi:phosphoglycolate phosphatase-like HAD superfamily hydrolase
MRKLVLFDIDGTLVLTGGAGLRAMTRALKDVLGHEDGLKEIPLAGRTDWAILSDAVNSIGRSLDDELFEALRTGYIHNLAIEIESPGRGIKAVMPGVRELLDVLSARDDVFVGLLTGNFEEGARIKLEHFDLWRYFGCGAFGGDAADRNALVPFAVRRARACGLPELGTRDVIVVGDTPHDVSCAHAASAVAVAVATGGHTVDQLRQTGADLVVADLSDATTFMELLH